MPSIGRYGPALRRRKGSRGPVVSYFAAETGAQLYKTGIVGISGGAAKRLRLSITISTTSESSLVAGP
jgi:hypothetical protein